MENSPEMVRRANGGQRGEIKEERSRFKILGSLFRLQIHRSRPFCGVSFFYNAVFGRARGGGFCTVSFVNGHGRSALDFKPSQMVIDVVFGARVSGIWISFTYPHHWSL